MARAATNTCYRAPTPVFGLASRQTEGFLRSLLTLLNLDNDVPDHSTISRRKARLGKVASYERRTVKPVHLLIDSSGLSVHVGQLRTPPKARDYRKLHLAVDEHEPMRAGRDRPTGQARPRRVHRARRTGRRRWRSGPCHRRCAPPGLPVRWRGGTAVGRGHRGARATAATPPVLVAPSPAIAAPAVPGVASMSVPPPPNGVRGATQAIGRPWRRFARADETRERRPDVGLRASLRQMVTP